MLWRLLPFVALILGLGADVRAEVVEAQIPTPATFVSARHSVRIDAPAGLTYCRNEVEADGGPPFLFLIPKTSCKPRLPSEGIGGNVYPTGVPAISFFIGENVTYRSANGDYDHASGWTLPEVIRFRTVDEALDVQCRGGVRELPRQFTLLGKAAAGCRITRHVVRDGVWHETVAIGLFALYSVDSNTDDNPNRLLNVVLWTTPDRLAVDMEVLGAVAANVSLCGNSLNAERIGRPACAPNPP